MDDDDDDDGSSDEGVGCWSNFGETVGGGGSGGGGATAGTIVELERLLTVLLRDKKESE